LVFVFFEVTSHPIATLAVPLFLNRQR
jgi:hypothetical protein